jgi:hypothetical protein
MTAETDPFMRPSFHITTDDKIISAGLPDGKKPEAGGKTEEIRSALAPTAETGYNAARAA